MKIKLYLFFSLMSLSILAADLRYEFIALSEDETAAIAQDVESALKEEQQITKALVSALKGSRTESRKPSRVRESLQQMEPNLEKRKMKRKIRGGERFYTNVSPEDIEVVVSELTPDEVAALRESRQGELFINEYGEKTFYDSTDTENMATHDFDKISSDRKRALRELAEREEKERVIEIITNFSELIMKLDLFNTLPENDTNPRIMCRKLLMPNYAKLRIELDTESKGSYHTNEAYQIMSKILKFINKDETIQAKYQAINSKINKELEVKIINPQFVDSAISDKDRLLWNIIDSFKIQSSQFYTSSIRLSNRKYLFGQYFLELLKLFKENEKMNFNNYDTYLPEILSS